ncbi:uncharacterized protein LOC128761200 isoform X3 [Synchiropus splendidus]|nr:uncharacterized protein LOC128761200 isoform X3 [Synchiropus splendidus]XP_053725231.1 uncharacterized protein LOC128761200 isoform X3 [Synchiropus splendidus]
MPPKRERGSGEASSEPPLRMIKIGEEGQDVAIDITEDKFRLGEEQYRYQSHFSNDEHSIEYDDERESSPGIRTDTVSLLMKIDQLQAQLKYERRCRLLAERELRELKEMNTLMLQMRHTAHELRVTLGNVLQGEDHSVTPPSSQDDVSSYMAEPETEIRTIHHLTGEDQTFIYLAENLRVPKSLYERIAEISDYKKYTSALLMLLFDRETLATHSLQGRRTASNGDEGHKPQLPPEILTSIIDFRDVSTARKRDRDAASSTSDPPLKMIRIGDDGLEVGVEKFRTGEGHGFPSPFHNIESDTNEYNEERAASPVRTDTISLLMKINQLQAQLKYERRCRLLAERELSELKEKNNLVMEMRHTAHELRVVLDHVLQGGQQCLEPQSSQEDGGSFMTDADVGMRTIHQIPEQDDDIVYLAENLRVPKSLYDRIAEMSDYKKYTSALLMLLFDRETLATHSLQGRRSSHAGDDGHKPQLPPEILTSLIEHVALRFGVDCSQIKTAIRTKLNNEDKLLKKRLGLDRAENKHSAEHNVFQNSVM